MKSKIPYSDRNNLKNLVHDRIECIKKCKRQLSSKVNKIIDYIKEEESKQQKFLNSLISGWEELLLKFNYDESEIYRIKKINSVKLKCFNSFSSIDIESIKMEINEPLYEVFPITGEKFDELNKNFNKVHSDTITVFLKSCDGSLVFTGGNDGIIRKFSSSFEQLWVYNVHCSPVTCLAISSCGLYLASGSVKSACVHLVDSPEETFYLSGHDSSICRVSFSADSQYVLTGSEEKIILHHLKYNLNITTFNLCGECSVIRKFGEHEYFISKDNTSFFIFKLGYPKAPLKKIDRNMLDCDNSYTFTRSGNYFVISDEEYHSENCFYVLKTKINNKIESSTSEKLPRDEYSARKMKKNQKFTKFTYKRHLMAIDNEFHHVAYVDDQMLNVWDTSCDMIVNSINGEKIISILGIYDCRVLFMRDTLLYIWDFIVDEEINHYDDFEKYSFSDYSPFTNHLVIGGQNNLSVHEFPSMFIIFCLNKEKSYPEISSAAISKEESYIYIIFTSKLEKWDYFNSIKMFKVKFNHIGISRAYLTVDQKFLGVFDHSLLRNYVFDTIKGDLYKCANNPIQALYTMYADSLGNTGIIYYQISIFYFIKDLHHSY